MFILCRYGSTCIKYICVYHLPTKPPHKIQQHTTPHHTTPHLHSFSSVANLIQYLHHRVLRNSPQIPAPYLYPPSVTPIVPFSYLPLTNHQRPDIYIYIYIYACFSPLITVCNTGVSYPKTALCEVRSGVGVHQWLYTVTRHWDD